MSIVYKVLEVKQHHDRDIEVVIGIEMPVTINGYGGGRLTIRTTIDEAVKVIEERVRWKLTMELAPVDVSDLTIEGILDPLQVVIDARLEAERLEAERLEAERLEAERLEAERLEAERLEAERLEAERIQREHVDQERHDDLLKV